MTIRVIGGGLAGSEAALTAARLGCEVDLFEMRAVVDGKLRLTPAHQTTDFAELVCSNSLKSESPNTAPWLLKQEMRRGASALLRLADVSAVPAGHALAVDRAEFSRRVGEAIAAEPRIRVIREEVTHLDSDLVQDENGTKCCCCTIVATGPLTSDALTREIERITGSGRLAFYDSISPIVDADSIDMGRVYMAARWDKGTPDYINCPMTREEYDQFYEALVAAEPAEAREWEKLECFAPKAPDASSRGPQYFEGCLPIEVLARRGRDTLRFGPMKPVGLRDPQTGKTPWAVVQLRKEDLRASSYNLVGFQNHLKFGDQARVLRLIPGLENARFLRYGQMHRNTYICAPALLDECLRLAPRTNTASADGSHPERPESLLLPEGAVDISPGWTLSVAKGESWESVPHKTPSPVGATETEHNSSTEGAQRVEGSASPAPEHSILFAGQICGVEGYTESIATGMLAGIYAAAIAHGREPAPVPRATALGSLVHYITHAEAKNFQPANMTFDLLEPLDEETRKKIRDKKERHRLQCERALAAFSAWQLEFERLLALHTQAETSVPAPEGESLRPSARLSK